MLNGNLVLQSRLNQLNKWYTALSNAHKFKYNLDLFYTKEVPNYIEKLREVSLNNAWLSGFTDAEGCFSVKINNDQKAYIQLLFILDQKNEEDVLNNIALLFTTNKKATLRTPNKRTVDASSSGKDKDWNMFRLTFYCNDKKKIISSKIINYFNFYKLKTTKKESFRIWSEIMEILINKQPLSLEDLKLIRKLRGNINYFTIENQQRGYANKS